MERYRILRIYAKGAVLIEYKLERILSHVRKFIQMEAMSQASSVRDNIGGNKDPDKSWRSPFEDFGKEDAIELRKNSPCDAARLSTTGRMAREVSLGVGIIAVTRVGRSHPWLG